MSKIPIFLPSPLISFSQLCPVSDNRQENKDQAFVDIHEYYTFIIIPLVTSPGFAMREATQLLSLSSFTSSVVLCNCSRLKLICCLTQFLWDLEHCSSLAPALWSWDNLWVMSCCVSEPSLTHWFLKGPRGPPSHRTLH